MAACNSVCQRFLAIGRPENDVGDRDQVFRTASMIIHFHTLLVLSHLLALALGLGAALLADWVVLRKLVFGVVSERAAGQLMDLSNAVSAGLVLIWVTGALLMTDSALDTPMSIMNQKLWAKLVIVIMLTLNALLLHSIVLPRVTSRIGQPLFEASFGWLPTMSTLLGAVSAVSWMFAAYLGVARELNGQMNLVPILGSYLVALLLTWTGAMTLSHLVRHSSVLSRKFGVLLGGLGLRGANAEAFDAGQDVGR